MLKQINADLNDDNRSLKSAITISQAELEALEAEEKIKREHFRELSVQEEELLNSIATLDESFNAKSRDLDSLVKEYDTKKENYGKDLTLLEKKKQNISQDVLISKEEIQQIRQEQANRHKQLDERDKNLRLREARVNQQEKSIASNYNLLEL